MQTFMPYMSYQKTAECLDYRRLGKQRVETKQILQCLLGEGSLGWAHHPVVEAWRDYEESLAVYGLYICSEWRMRGYQDSLFPWFQVQRLRLRDGESYMTPAPPWTENLEVNRAYQQVLTWKEPEYYEEIFDMVQLTQPEFPWDLLKHEVLV
jgi:Pyrimidine dimer DNA glycosylase